jgi:predicted site-specific integrase-resolvase
MELQPADTPKYISPSEAAQLIGNITTARLRDWAERGHIRGRRLPSGRWQLLKVDVEQISKAQWRETLSLDEARDRLETAKLRLNVAQSQLETAQVNYDHALATLAALEKETA